MVWLYHSPIPVGSRGVINLFKWFLLAVTGLEEGGRVSAPCGHLPDLYILNIGTLTTLASWVGDTINPLPSVNTWNHMERPYSNRKDALTFCHTWLLYLFQSRLQKLLIVYCGVESHPYHQQWATHNSDLIRIGCEQQYNHLTMWHLIYSYCNIIFIIFIPYLHSSIKRSKHKAEVTAFRQGHRVYRVPGLLSSRPNWLPSPRKRVLPSPHVVPGGGATPPPRTKGGGAARRLVRGWGMSNYDDYRKA